MSVKKKCGYWLSALELTTVYLIVSVLYIMFSGRIAAALARDVAHLRQIEMLKGSLFVFVTGLLLFLYSRFVLKRDRQRQNDIQAHQLALLAAEKRNISSQMAWTIGHDINNILTIISFNIELIEEKMIEGEGSKKLVDTLGNATKRLQYLAQKLRDAGKDVARQEMKKFKVRETLEEAVELAEMVRGGTDCAVTVHCAPDLDMTGCSSVLQQAVFNVVLNAMDAVGEGSCIIEISVELSGDVVSISIHDNGPGIPDDQQSKIFDSFYTTKEKGTGLGLLSAQLCAQMHQGHLTICESRLGGACFCMELSAQVSEKRNGFNYAV